MCAGASARTHASYLVNHSTAEHISSTTHNPTQEVLLICSTILVCSAIQGIPAQKLGDSVSFIVALVDQRNIAFHQVHFGSSFALHNCGVVLFIRNSLYG